MSLQSCVKGDPMILTMIFFHENSFDNELGTTHQTQLIRTPMESSALKSSTMFILYYIKFKEILAAMRERINILLPSIASLQTLWRHCDDSVVNADT